MKLITTLSLAAGALAASLSNQFEVLEFANLGFDGYYWDVGSLNNPTSEDCSCSLSTTPTSFQGTNSPLNEPLSVHIRGPLILNSFAYYVTDSYTKGDSLGSWSRLAYYDSSSQTATNVTFLNHKGEASTCLGNALSYSSGNGTGYASSATTLAKGTLFNSDEELVILSSEQCDSSGSSNNCGVYREGIPAYQGYGGTTKMFLFDFEMPTESVVENGTVSYFDMPAIWLLNSKIPRTSQYPNNVSCSCWRSGCGEFDIFEVMNTTESHKLILTIHDYQGTGDIEGGLAIDGYIERDTENSMKGGVVFDSEGNAVVFISNSTSFSSNISSSDVSSWISSAGQAKVDTLSSVTNTYSPSSSSTKKGAATGGVQTHSIITNILVSIFSTVYFFFG